MHQEKNVNWGNKIYFPATLILICIMTFVLTYKFAWQPSDVNTHMNWANQYFEGSFNTVYPGFYLMYGFFNRVLKISDMYAVAYANTIFTFLCTIVIYGIVSLFFKNKLEISEKAKSLIVFFMMTFGPIYLLGFNGDAYYLGQGSFNTWHNPTNNAVRFLSMLVFYLFVYNFFYNEKGENLKIISTSLNKIHINIIISILTIVSLLLKPSFFQVFAPTIVVCVLADLMKGGG